MPADTILNCLRIMTKPLVRFCLRYSIKLQEIYEVIKYNLVIVAKEELEKTHTDVNASRLTLITGVHRPDINRIESQGIKTSAGDHVTKIIGQWQNDKRFTTPAGRPRTLEVVGKESEFTELVRSVNKELNPYTLLFELERISAVERTSKGLKLIAREYVPKGDIESSFRLLARDMDDLIATVEDNVFNDSDKPNHHIKTEYDRVPARFSAELKSWIQKEGADFHKRIRDHLAKFDKDLNPKLEVSKDEKFIRVAIGSNSTISGDKDNE